MAIPIGIKEIKMNYIKAINIYCEREVSLDEWELYKDAQGILSVSKWNIADKPQPTIEELEALEPQVIINENNENILKQISELESTQLRATREMILNPKETARNKLQIIENEIQQLRSQIMR